MPSIDRVKTRYDYERRNQNVVTIHVDEAERKRFHRKQVQLSELEKNRRADKTTKTGKKPLIDESSANYSF